MPQYITNNNQDGIIKIESRGIVTYKNSVETIDEIKKLVNKSGQGFILDDARTETEYMSINETYRFYSCFLPRFVKIAVLVDENSNTKINRKFGETVAKNLGYRVQVFNCEETAMVWLVNK